MHMRGGGERKEESKERRKRENLIDLPQTREFSRKTESEAVISCSSVCVGVIKKDNWRELPSLFQMKVGRFCVYEINNLTLVP